MLPSSVSSFWTKFKIYFPQEESSVFDSDGALSELDGYQVIQARFAIYPARDDNNVFAKPHRSCFNLLSHLTKKDGDGTILNKENFIANLFNNAELIESLKSSNNSENMSNFNPQSYQIVFSVENDKTLYRIPTHDFACVRHLDSLIICTALDENPSSEFVFLKIRTVAPELESALKDFMINPLTSNSISNGFDQLPSMDMSNVIIHSQGNFENFIDDTQAYSASNNFNSPSTSISQQESSRTTNNKTSSNSPSRPAKKTETIKTYSNPSSRQCLNCFCTSTPMWRRGPDGTASLCNACGVKFKSGKLQMSAELVEANLKKIRLSQPTLDSKENFDNNIDNDQNNINYNNQIESNLILHQY